MTESLETAETALRDQIVSHIKGAIETGDLRSGDPMPSERRLAEQFQVARDTVRRAYQELARQGCILSNGRARRTVAALQPSPHSLLQHTFAILGSTVFQEEWLERVDAEDHFVLANAARQIEAAGFHVMFINAQTLVGHGIDSILAGRPLGVLCSTGLLDQPEIRSLIQTLRDTDSACLVYGDTELELGCDRLSSDHVAGAGMLAEWLIARGRRRLLPVFPGTGLRPFMASRVRGIHAACAAADLVRLAPVAIPPLTHDRRKDMPFEEQVRLAAGFLAEHLLGAGAADAVLTTNDPDAYLIAAACRRLQLEPNVDVLLAGYDNSWSRATEMAHEACGPAVTIDKCNRDLAAAVAELALGRGRRELSLERREIAVPPKLVVLGQHRPRT